MKQLAAFKLHECSVKDFDTVNLPLPDGEKPVAGRVMETTTCSSTRAGPGPYVVWKNYVSALQGIGAKLLTDPNDFNHAVLNRQTPQGEYWYVYMHGSGNEESTTTYNLVTLLAGGPAPKKCTLTVYGINFDFDQATLRPDSCPCWSRFASSSPTTRPTRRRSAGHTDNQGARDYNLKLSATRADAVKAWLAARASPQSHHDGGYGDTHPLVPNTVRREQGAQPESRAAARGLQGVIAQDRKGKGPARGPAP